MDDDPTPLPPRRRPFHSTEITSTRLSIRQREVLRILLAARREKGDVGIPTAEIVEKTGHSRQMAGKLLEALQYKLPLTNRPYRVICQRQAHSNTWRAIPKAKPTDLSSN